MSAIGLVARRSQVGKDAFYPYWAVPVTCRVGLVRCAAMPLVHKELGTPETTSDTDAR